MEREKIFLLRLESETQWSGHCLRAPRAALDIHSYIAIDWRVEQGEGLSISQKAILLPHSLAHSYFLSSPSSSHRSRHEATPLPDSTEFGPKLPCFLSPHVFIGFSRFQFDSHHFLSVGSYHRWIDRYLAIVRIGYFMKIFIARCRIPFKHLT